MAETRPRVSAIVVNFNAGHHLQDCVRSLLEVHDGIPVIVADNASTDDSIEGLAARFRGHPLLDIRHNPSNIGFARAVNAEAKRLDSDHILVINPDCELLPGALERMSAALQADPRAALAGPRVTDGQGRVERASRRRFPRPWTSLLTVTGLWRLGRWVPALRGVPAADEGAGDRTGQADAVSGACMLLRRDALEQVGYLDEAYGLHCEDLDLMYRLAGAGWHCLYVPAAGAVHRQGVSSRSRPLWVHWQKHRGMARFYRKFLAAEYAAPVSWLVVLGIWSHFMLKLPVAWLRR